MATGDATQLSTSQYAAHRKELLSLMSQLRALGAQGELELPRIVVIGNQSAGNPSLPSRPKGRRNMYSVSNGVSTVVFHQSLVLSHLHPSRFINMITNKDEVELALRRAQFAVLNPRVPFENVLKMNVEDLKNGVAGSKPLRFSRNVVCIDLEGPELTDLMFLDLPGIIANAEPEIVNLVEEMVLSHIRGNCLILVALPMTDDIENQKALRLARQEDPEGTRTIGVLTKPDMLSVGSKARDSWLDVIERPQTPSHPWNITPAQARRAETTFFTETAPWSTTEHKNRFGTENLVSTLSTLLVQIINDRLPLIRSMANERMDQCRRELEALPAKVQGEPATHMLNLITAFCTIIRQNTAFAEFKHSIYKSQPQFIARARGQAGTHIEIDNETPATATELIASQKPVFLTDIRAHIVESITRELPGNIPFSAKKTLITAFQYTWFTCAGDCFNSVKHSMLALLMRCIDEKFGRYEHLQARLKTCITDLTTKYFESCGNFLMAMLEVEQMPFTQNDEYLRTSTEKWLSRYKDERAGKTKNSHDEPGSNSKRRKLDGVEPSGSTSRVAEVFKFGVPTPAPSSPSVTDSPDLAPSMSSGSTPSGLSKLKPPAEGSRSRSSRPVSPSNAAMTDSDWKDKVNNVLAELAELGYPGVMPEDFGKLRPVDEFETEIAVMSEVKGYFQCAFKRVIDNIPALIDSKFLRAIAQNLQQELISEFGLGSENANAVCATFLVEDPRVVARREELMTKSRRLEAVRIQLHNFGLNKSAGAGLSTV
ncbi:hypothetical protein MVEN_00745500 [Mycena venus]|uniref:Dynamin GTPase n=1 Tax=Mycena venus TaxID=2733690 RepID=A0A8H6YLL6_9AGAR|nr:hypothetical protein MVEN_00745500 [Mycena venus]